VGTVGEEHGWGNPICPSWLQEKFPVPFGTSRVAGPTLGPAPGPALIYFSPPRAPPVFPPGGNIHPSPRAPLRPAPTGLLPRVNFDGWCARMPPPARWRKPFPSKWSVSVLSSKRGAGLLAGGKTWGPGTGKFPPPELVSPRRICTLGASPGANHVRPPGPVRQSEHHGAPGVELGGLLWGRWGGAPRDSPPLFPPGIPPRRNLPRGFFWPNKLPHRETRWAHRGFFP